MKYFTPQLLAEFNSKDDEIVEKSYVKWEQAIEDYGKYYESIKDVLPPTVQYLNDSFCLHDAAIEELMVDKTSALMKCTGMPFRKDKTESLIIFFGLYSPIRGMKPPENKHWYWCYEEFIQTGDNKFELHILLDDHETELVIPFQGDIEVYK